MESQPDIRLRILESTNVDESTVPVVGLVQVALVRVLE